MKGREEKVKPLPVWCRQQSDIYSQRLGQGVVFHLETHKLTGSSKQRLPQPGVCGPVCHTSFPPSLHVCWQANDSRQTFTFTHQRLRDFPLLHIRGAPYGNVTLCWYLKQRQPWFTICVGDIITMNMNNSNMFFFYYGMVIKFNQLGFQISFDTFVYIILLIINTQLNIVFLYWVNSKGDSY